MVGAFVCNNVAIIVAKVYFACIILAVKLITMKPFDLEKALAGEPVVTRDGRPVKIAAYNPDANDYAQLLIWLDGDAYSCHRNGKRTKCSESSLDLFMAEKPKVKKEGWVNVFKSKYDDKTSIVKTSGKIYGMEEFALNRQNDCFPNHYIATVKIEWEEEA